MPEAGNQNERGQAAQKKHRLEGEMIMYPCSCWWLSLPPLQKAYVRMKPMHSGEMEGDRASSTDTFEHLDPAVTNARCPRICQLGELSHLFFLSHFKVDFCF